MGVCNKLTALQQQFYARIEKKSTAVVQKIGHLKAKNAHLQEQLALRKAGELSIPSLNPAVTALQSEVASLQVKWSTAANTEATAVGPETPAWIGFCSLIC